MKNKNQGAPNLYTAEEFYNWEMWARDGDGRYTFMCRPLGWRGLSVYSFMFRLKLAWHVFTGKYDALQWKQDDE